MIDGQLRVNVINSAVDGSWIHTMITNNCLKDHTLFQYLKVVQYQHLGLFQH